ncbi:hypothetical protein MBLNU459_g5558t1 [Dothideomycetes sp. NU459]
MPDSSTLDELPPLTDDDVNILYSIVSLAQQSPDPPFRALFAAYDAVLAENDIATEHDQIYFRYLLRLGEGPTVASNQTLVVKFRTLLSRLGIHLVLGDDDAAMDEAARDAPMEDSVMRKTRGHDNAGRARRRMSFNDSNLDTTWLSGGRLATDEVNPGPRRRTSAASGAPKPSPRHAMRYKVPNGVDNIAPPPSQPLRGRLPSKHAPVSRARSLSTQGSVRIVRGASTESWAHHVHEDISVSENSDLDYLGSSPPPISVIANAPTLPLYHPSNDQMLSDADAFFSTTIVKAARQCLHHWHDKTIRAAQTHQDLLQVASNYDRQTLMHQAVSLWHTALADKRQNVETERFFQHFERRAARARDLFLLNKAFTHWAQSASDQVVRTNVARRHILRTRYFNAWRDITAVNEFKCRRLGLRKWFPVWRIKTATRALETERAVTLFEEKLVERTYWKWFWGFCGRRAPLWKEARLKRTCFDRLLTCSVVSRDMDIIARRTRDNKLRKKHLAVLIDRWQSLSANDNRAIELRRNRILISSFVQLKRQADLLPIARHSEQTFSRRLAARAMSVWQLNNKLAGHATAIDQQRMLRSAWISWNDRLRSKALASKIDDRIVLQALYKWLLIGRLALFQRVMDHKLKESSLQRLSLQLATLRFQLGEASLMFQSGQRRRLLQSAMLKFHRKTHTEEHQERQALEFRNARAIQVILPGWQAKSERVQALERWARDARFYCLTTSALKRWRAATTDAKRIRRRDAYAAVRRRIKITLVHNCLETWRRKSMAFQSMNAQADTVYQAHLVSIGTSVFDQWAFKASHSIDLQARGADIYIRHLFTLAISRLSSQGQQIQQHHHNATVFAIQSTDAIAVEMLKRLKWSLFCHKRASENAVALEERNAAQHRRNMLRYWAEQARTRKASKGIKDRQDSPTKPAPTSITVPTTVPAASPSPKTEMGSGTDLFKSLRLSSARKSPAIPPSLARAEKGTRGDPGRVSDEEEIDFGATHRAEEWTSFDILGSAALPTLDEDAVAPAPIQPFATPIPGYLRTPSKRTVRQNARFRNLASIQKPGSAPAGYPMSKHEPSAGGLLTTTTPAPFRPSGLRDMETLTPQITPFERKMRAGGYSRTPLAEPLFADLSKSTFAPPAPSFGERPPTFGDSIRFEGPAGFTRSDRLGGATGEPVATGRSVRFFDIDGAHEKSS